MQISTANTPLAELETEVLIVPLLQDVSPSRIKGFDAALTQVIERVNHHGDWKGELNELGLFYLHDLADNPFPTVKRILLVGMGKQADWEYDHLRQAVATAVGCIHKRQFGNATCILPPASTAATAKDLAAIAVMATWQFTHYKTGERPANHDLQLSFLTMDHGVPANDLPKAVADGQAIGQAVNYVRDLANHPANVMTPNHLAADAKELASETVRVTVYGQKELEKMKMGALLAVARGSSEEPKLIVVEYSPRSSEQRTANSERGEIPTVALVGKGITFDSGGISIKPSEGMDEMKLDMAGAATCLGVIAAAAALQLPIRIVAVLPTTENLPSGTAIKPGDIVTAYDGQTIEILNTDAEGRVVLADGLAYAVKEFQPQAVIDLATLTGAAIVAFGHEVAPLFGNNDQLLHHLEAAAKRTGERVWPMPLLPEYKQLTKSEIADVQNIGAGRRNAALTTSAAFLSFFVPDSLPWIHVDIAGTGMLDKPRAYMPKGGSGWGVRLLVDFLEHWNQSVGK
ncbi:leucyl aminopeptidase [Candidatus Berkelbacteria bacterium]|nr:leucyl aminopeptidase [Candidatus Berkelbacteria bacterium]